MCDDWYPTVETFCGVVSVRVGLLFIGVLSITTGAITLGIMEQQRNVDYDMVMAIYHKAKIFRPSTILKDLGRIITMVCSFMSVIFMLAGLILIFSTLSDQEGFAQFFVLLISLNILIGAIALMAICYECATSTNNCLFGDMDWLTGAAAVLALVCYLILWYYFCCVANSYALNPLV